VIGGIGPIPNDLDDPPLPKPMHPEVERRFAAAERIGGAFIKALRDPKNLQCFGIDRDSEGRRSALALFDDVVEAEAAHRDRLEAIVNRAQLLHWNDGLRLTFPQIARGLKWSWFMDAIVRTGTWP
jgi:hypothetical protein